MKVDANIFSRVYDFSSETIKQITFHLDCIMSSQQSCRYINILCSYKMFCENVFSLKQKNNCLASCSNIFFNILITRAFTQLILET